MAEQETRVRDLGDNDYIQIQRAMNGWVAMVNIVMKPHGLTTRKRFIAKTFGELCEELECFLAEDAPGSG